MYLFVSCQQSNDSGGGAHEPTIAERRMADEPATGANQDNSQLRPYIDQLSNHRLMKFSLYNSGSGGEGMQSEGYIDLCSSGSYFSHQSSSLSIGGNTSQKSQDDEGTWEVTGSAVEPMLKFTSWNGRSMQVKLGLDGTKLYLDGERWYHIPKGDDNGPQACN